MGNLKVWFVVAVTVFQLWACSPDLGEDFTKAAKAGDLERVASMLAKGVDIEYRDQKRDASALMWAAHEGHVDVLQLLLDKGAKVNTRQQLGRSALWYAAQQGQLEAAKLLAEHGADLNVTSNEGVTAVMAAKQKGFTEIAEYLVKQGASQ